MMEQIAGCYITDVRPRSSEQQSAVRVTAYILRSASMKMLRSHTVIEGVIVSHPIQNALRGTVDAADEQ